MQVISDLDELERRIAECNDALTHGSDDAMRRLFNGFRMDFSADCPADPFSPEYRAFQLNLYRRLTGKRYDIVNERTAYVTDEHRRRPFPYCTGSTGTAGQHLMAIGFLLRALDLPKGARVVEFGPGWGNTTIALASLGHHVTAVDIEPNFCGIIRERAAREGVGIEVVQGDFFWAETVREPVDAVVFFECFHHCDDHLRLLRALRGMLKPGGKAYFASEPILPDYPVPWGLRMDGEALWAIRNFGWLELGFSERYFEAALAREGWAARKHGCPDPFWASVWEAWPAEGGIAAPALPQPPAKAVEPAEPTPAAPPDRDDALARELAAMYRSTSWRVTAPLRAFKRLVRR